MAFSMAILLLAFWGGKVVTWLQGRQTGSMDGGFHWCAECCNRSSSWSETPGCTPGTDEHQLVQWAGRKCGVIAGFAHRAGARRSRDVALCVELELDTPVQLTPASRSEEHTSELQS